MSFRDLEKEKDLLSNSKIFSPYLVFYRFCARLFANKIIKPDGLIELDALKKCSESLDPESIYSLEDQTNHLKNIFRLLEDKIFQKKIYQFDLPISPDFEKFVRLSLELTNEPVTKSHLRKAVLQALMSYLRQTVGSCFATAPCLYILKKHPDYVLDDLFQLSKKSSLDRISQGKTITVPMALSIGEHFLDATITGEFINDSVFLNFQKNHSCNVTIGKSLKESLSLEKALQFYNQAYDPLLKIWEYTIASFCDARGEFSESTLFLTLGLDAKIPEGLGEFFQEIFQKKLDEKHLLLVEAQNEAYLAHQRLIMAETMAKNATTEASFQRSKSEIVAANYQLHARQLDLEDAKKEQTKIRQLYEKKMTTLKEGIPLFFQESYDPDLVDMKDYSEDAPAGFRLFIKDNQLTSRFKPIHTESDFIKALKHFFETIEKDLTFGKFDKEEVSMISNVITETIQFSSSKKFLEQTYLRAKKRHPKALPWAYVSGGTLETLIKTYFRKEFLKIHPLKGDNLLQFFVHLVEYFKSLPETYLEPFRNNRHQGLLLETKHHACQLLPGSAFFQTFWESSGFTYTEARDKLLNAGLDFYEKRHANTEIPDVFFKAHRKNLPTQTIHHFLHTHPSPKESVFIASSFLISGLSKEQREKQAGYCVIGDTNWTYNGLVIGYHPLTKQLALFAQDPESAGLLHLDHIESFPLYWKIYEDLSRVDLFVPGIKI